MFAAVLALAQVVSGDSLRLTVNGRDAAVETFAEARATFVSAEAATMALGGRLQRLPNHRYLVSVGGVAFEIADRSSFALSDGRIYPLVAAAREHDGRFDVPVQLFTDIAPRAGARLAWDTARQRLATLASVATAPVVAPSVASPVAPNAAPMVALPTPTAPHVTSVVGGNVISSSGARTSRAVPTAGSRTQSSGSVGSRGARRRVVVVDAGHGGRDPGMRGWDPDRTPVREKDVTLGVALRLEQELGARGYDVVMTRSTDTLIALSDRGKIANRSKGDLFISVHVNAANPNWRDPHAARGFETYFLAEAKTEDERRVAEMENEVVRFETDADAPKHDPLGFIINDMAQNEHLRESNDLAEGIQRALHRVHPGPSRGVKQAGFRVLVTAYMPAVLVEVGFGTNGSEARFISSDAGQRTIAAAIADAAADYLARYEQRVGNGK
ncbi:MAG: N-acetylmuramoyl-L-alanine amidase [Gemmatimonadetes bacterium]|nr:N-acetylmuramoyl-L-alanine amidase [Gemmatimonadota bacterium]